MNKSQQKKYNELVIFANNNGCSVISCIYVDIFYIMEFMCPQGHHRNTSPKNFKRYPTGCKLCPNKKMVEARYIFIQRIDKLGGKVTGVYINKDIPIECVCINNHVCFPTPGSIQQGRGMCLICAGQCPKESKQKFIDQINILGGTVTGEYINTNIPVNCICKNGHLCSPRPSDINQGQGMCKKCVFLCPIEAEKRFKEIVLNLKGTIVGIYVNSETPIHCICYKNHDCYPNLDKLKARGVLCKTCASIDNDSYGEKLVCNALNFLHFEYKREIIPVGLKRLKFDFQFYYDDKTYYIEYDGIQHQEYTHYLHRSLDRFEKSRQRDLVKNFFIKNSENCALIRLDHSWEKDRRLKNQGAIQKNLVEYILLCLSESNKKLFYNSAVYNWIDDEPDKSLLSDYLDT